jgi:hypothetical protein
MSRFYASIQGERGEATRMGHKGIHGHIRGWGSGVKVQGFVNDDGRDLFLVYATSGSTGSGSDRLIAYVYADGEVERFDA